MILVDPPDKSPPRGSRRRLSVRDLDAPPGGASPPGRTGTREATLSMKEAAGRREAWGLRACAHPQVALHTYLGLHLSEEVCLQCGRVITRDRDGRPIPSPAGAP